MSEKDGLLQTTVTVYAACMIPPRLKEDKIFPLLFTIRSSLPALSHHC